jgi:hypothetical protein
MNNSVIFVTAFKNLNRHNWKGFERSVDNYVNYFANLTMIPIRLICYCEDEVRDILHNKLKFFNTYPYKPEETFFRFIEKERVIMDSMQFKALVKHRNDPETNKPEYNSATHNKSWFLKRTKDMFPNYTHYAWIDFGYIRTKNNIPTQLNFASLPDNKILFSTMKPLQIDKLLNPIEACIDINSQTLIGGLYFCPKDMVDWYYKEYYNMVMSYYANNLVDDDQEIVKQLLKNHTDKFKLVVTGGWFELLNRFKVPLTIDVVIPTCLKDLDTLGSVIKGIKRNVEHVRNIYVVCNHIYKDKIKEGIFIDEEIYPFNMASIKSIIHNILMFYPHGRQEGWWFQQLLKLYSFQVIKNISSNILIVDSETIFYNKYRPIKDNKAYYAVSKEVFHHFRIHMKHLLNDINIFSNRISGICHQMLFQTHVLQNLIDRVEKYHLDMRGIYMPFWKIMLTLAERYKIYYSEYDIYFNFMLTFHRNAVKITNNISWDVSATIPGETNYTYITAHSILRHNKLLKHNSFYINLKSLGINDACIEDNNGPELQTQSVMHTNMFNMQSNNRKLIMMRKY